jgi:phosphatidylglycerol:prolipoprotein diacylglycerol transferase
LYQYIYANYFWLGGGFVFYGGLIFGLLFYFIWSLGLKKFDFSKSKYLLPGLIFGHAIGRVGCLLTGCCYGAKTNSFFSIYIQNERRIPVQGFEALALLIIGFVILKMLKDQKANQFIIQSYLISYSIIRFFLEYFRGDEIRGVFFQYTSTSQLISIIIIVTILIKKIFLKNETA